MYAAGNSSVATEDIKNAAIADSNGVQSQIISGIVQTGSFFNHTHKTAGLTYEQLPPPAEYSKDTIKIPIGAILIAPKSNADVSKNLSAALYLTKDSFMNDIDGKKYPDTKVTDNIDYRQGLYAGVVMPLGLNQYLP